jgi:hypothetical protein
MGSENEYSGGYTINEDLWNKFFKKSTSDNLLQSGTASAPQAPASAPILPQGSGSIASVRRFERLPLWQELRFAPQWACGYEFKNSCGGNWQEGGNSSIQDCIKGLLSSGFKEVTLRPGSTQIVASGYDPNDLQTQDAALWGNSKPCCGGGVGTSGFFVNGKWHDSTCDAIKSPTQNQLPGYSIQQNDHKEAPRNLGRCTCGSSAVGSDRHSSWCDIK